MPEQKNSLSEIFGDIVRDIPNEKLAKYVDDVPSDALENDKQLKLFLKKTAVRDGPKHVLKQIAANAEKPEHKAAAQAGIMVLENISDEDINEIVSAAEATVGKMFNEEEKQIIAEITDSETPISVAITKIGERFANAKDNLADRFPNMATRFEDISDTLDKGTQGLQDRLSSIATKVASAGERIAETLGFELTDEEKKLMDKIGTPEFKNALGQEIEKEFGDCKAKLSDRVWNILIALPIYLLRAYIMIQTVKLTVAGPIISIMFPAAAPLVALGMSVAVILEKVLKSVQRALLATGTPEDAAKMIEANFWKALDDGDVVETLENLGTQTIDAGASLKSGGGIWSTVRGKLQKGIEMAGKYTIVDIDAFRKAADDYFNGLRAKIREDVGAMANLDVIAPIILYAAYKSAYDPDAFVEYVVHGLRKQIKEKYGDMNPMTRMKNSDLYNDIKTVVFRLQEYNRDFRRIYSALQQEETINDFIMYRENIFNYKQPKKSGGNIARSMATFNQLHNAKSGAYQMYAKSVSGKGFSGGLDSAKSLVDYIGTPTNLAKEDLAEKLVSALDKLFVKNKPSGGTNDRLKAYISKIYNSASKFNNPEGICKKVAAVINNSYGRDVIDSSGSIKEVCRKTAEVLSSLTHSMASEFLQASSAVEEVTDRIDALIGLQQNAFDELKKRASKLGLDKNAIRDIQDAMGMINTELTRNNKMLKGYTGTTLSSTEKTLRRLLDRERKLMHDDSDFNATVKKVLSGISSTGYVADTVNEALKKVSLSLNDYLKADSFDDVLMKLVDKYPEVSKKMDRGELKKFKEFMDAIHALEKNFGRAREAFAQGAYDGAYSSDEDNYGMDIDDHEYAGGAKPNTQYHFNKPDFVDESLDKSTDLENYMELKKDARLLKLLKFEKQFRGFVQSITAPMEKLLTKLGNVKNADSLVEFNSELKTLGILVLKDNRNIPYILSGYNQGATETAKRDQFYATLSRLANFADRAKNDSALSAIRSELTAIASALRSFLKTSDKSADEYKQERDEFDPNAYIMSNVGRSPFLSSKRGGDESIYMSLDDAVDNRIDGKLSQHEKRLHGGFSGGAIDLLDDSNTSSGLFESIEKAVTRIAKPIHDFQKITEKLSYAININQVRLNMRSNAKSLENLSKDYIEMTGRGIADKINNIRENYGKLLGKLEGAFKGSPSAAIAEPLKEFLRNQENARTSFWQTVEAVDNLLYLMTGTLMRNPDNIRDISSLVEDVRVINNWYNESTGNNIACVFEQFPSFIKSDGTGIEQPSVQSEMDTLGEKKHYYELFNGKTSSSGNNKDLPGNPLLPIKGDKIKNAIAKTMDALNGLTVLKNLLTVFVYTGSKVERGASALQTYMSPNDIYKNMVSYICYSAYISVEQLGDFDIKYNDTNGKYEAGTGGDTYNVGTTGPEFNVSLKKNNPNYYGAIIMRSAVIKSADLNASDNNMINEMKEEDEIFQMTIKAISAKVFTILGTYNMFTNPGHLHSKPDYHLRTIIGGAQNKKANIKPEYLDTYVRVPLLLNFYKELFRMNDTFDTTEGMGEHTKSYANQSDIMGDSLGSNFSDTARIAKISLVPDIGSGFGKLLSLIFKNTIFGQNNVTYSNSDLADQVEAINELVPKLKTHAKSGHTLAVEVSQALVNEVNRRYGLLTQRDYNLLKQLTLDNSYNPRDDNSDSKYLDIPKGSDYPILPGEESAFSRSIISNPSQKYITNPSAFRGEYSKKGTFKYMIHKEHMYLLYKFRCKLSALLSKNVTHSDSLKSAIISGRQKLRNVSADKRAEYVYSLMRTDFQTMETSGTDLSLLFHDTVIAGQNTLSAMWKMFKNVTNKLKSGTSNEEIIRALIEGASAGILNYDLSGCNLVPSFDSFKSTFMKLYESVRYFANAIRPHLSDNTLYDKYCGATEPGSYIQIYDKFIKPVLNGNVSNDDSLAGITKSISTTFKTKFSSSTTVKVHNLLYHPDTAISDVEEPNAATTVEPSSLFLSKSIKGFENKYIDTRYIFRYKGLYNYTGKEDDLKGHNILYRFNRIVASLIHTNTVTGYKVYNGTLDAITNVFRNIIDEPGLGYIDTISAKYREDSGEIEGRVKVKQDFTIAPKDTKGKHILNKPHKKANYDNTGAAAAPTDTPPTTLHHGIPKDGRILFSSLGYILQNIIESTDKGGEQIHVASNISEIHRNDKDKIRSSLMQHIHMLNCLRYQCEIIEGLSRNQNIKLDGSGQGASTGLDFLDIETDDMPQKIREITRSIKNAASMLSSGLERALTGIGGPNTKFGEVFTGFNAEFKSKHGNSPYTPPSMATYVLNLTGDKYHNLLPSRYGGYGAEAFTFGILPLLVYDGTSNKYANFYDQVRNAERSHSASFDNGMIQSYLNSLESGLRTAYNMNMCNALTFVGAPTDNLVDELDVTKRSCFVADKVNPRSIVSELVDNSHDESLKSYIMSSCSLGGHHSACPADLHIQNIIDMNIMPVNVHLLARDIPLANIYNYAFTFDRMCVELIFGKYPKYAKKLTDNLCTNSITDVLNDITDVEKGNDAASLFLNLLINPFVEIGKTEDLKYTDTKDNSDKTYHDPYGQALTRYFIGDDNLGLGRPKFLSDQLYSKSLFGDLFLIERDQKNAINGPKYGVPFGPNADGTMSRSFRGGYEEDLEFDDAENEFLGGLFQGGVDSDENCKKAASATDAHISNGPGQGLAVKHGESSGILIFSDAKISGGSGEATCNVYLPKVIGAKPEPPKATTAQIHTTNLEFLQINGVISSDTTPTTKDNDIKTKDSQAYTAAKEWLNNNTKNKKNVSGVDIIPGRTSFIQACNDDGSKALCDKAQDFVNKLQQLVNDATNTGDGDGGSGDTDAEYDNLKNEINTADSDSKVNNAVIKALNTAITSDKTKQPDYLHLIYKNANKRMLALGGDDVNDFKDSLKDRSSEDLFIRAKKPDSNETFNNWQSIKNTFDAIKSDLENEKYKKLKNIKSFKIITNQCFALANGIENLQANEAITYTNLLATVTTQIKNHNFGYILGANDDLSNLLNSIFDNLKSFKNMISYKKVGNNQEIVDGDIVDKLGDGITENSIGTDDYTGMYQGGSDEDDLIDLIINNNTSLDPDSHKKVKEIAQSTYDLNTKKANLKSEIQKNDPSFIDQINDALDDWKDNVGDVSDATITKYKEAVKKLAQPQTTNSKYDDQKFIDDLFNVTDVNQAKQDLNNKIITTNISLIPTYITNYINYSGLDKNTKKTKWRNVFDAWESEWLPNRDNIGRKFGQQPQTNNPNPKDAIVPFINSLYDKIQNLDQAKKDEYIKHAFKDNLNMKQNQTPSAPQITNIVNVVNHIKNDSAKKYDDAGAPTGDWDKVHGFWNVGKPNTFIPPQDGPADNKHVTHEFVSYIVSVGDKIKNADQPAVQKIVNKVDKDLGGNNNVTLPILTSTFNKMDPSNNSVQQIIENNKRKTDAQLGNDWTTLWGLHNTHNSGLRTFRLDAQQQPQQDLSKTANDSIFFLIQDSIKTNSDEHPNKVEQVKSVKLDEKLKYVMQIVGRLRFDTVFMRNLIFITNVYRAFRDTLNKLLEKDNEHSIGVESGQKRNTEFKGNDTVKVFGGRKQPR